MVRTLLLVAGFSALDPDPCTLGGGDDGGVEEAAASQTVGTQCTAVVTELCTQGPRCAQSYDVTDCITTYMPQCCSSGNTCDQVSTSSQGDVDTCKSDIDAEDCNYIVNASFPASCTGLMHR
jgi:hypothetical protein